MEKYILVVGTILAFEDYVLILCLSFMERLRPRRSTRAIDETKRLRWTSNLFVYILDRFLLSLLPISGMALAVICAQRGWGLLNQVALPASLEFAFTIILIGLSSYATHYLLHRVPLLWRLHRLHHTDQNIDFSTAVRSHPLERIFTAAVGLCAVPVIGPAPSALLVFAPFFLAIQYFSHANLRLPESWDRFLRFFVVTPDMHRIHHSQLLTENMSNLGDVFPWFDWIFRTYRAEPELGNDIAFGVPEFTGRKHMMLHWMLAQPFLKEKTELQPARGKARVPQLGVGAMNS
jgi:sterol desaturase/sphingolipid hydroxylase (fatty acid hydroxylase superfamily)